MEVVFSFETFVEFQQIMLYPRRENSSQSEIMSFISVLSDKVVSDRYEASFITDNMV
jgi:hypothetical protein